MALAACCAGALGTSAAPARAQDDPVATIVEGATEAVEKAPGEAAALLAGEQGPLATTSNILCPRASTRSWA